jgi:hypothetical protein
MSNETIVVSQEVKDQGKAQRLRNLEHQYFELIMNKTAYEANNKTQQAAETAAAMAEVVTSYNAIAAIE